MSATPPGAAPSGSGPWTSRHGRAEGLQGLTGRLQLQVAGAPAGVLKVEDGEVEITPDGDFAAWMAADSQPTLIGLLGGELHPIIAHLQGKAWAGGDIAFVLKVFFGLQAGSPWTGLAARS